VFSRPPRTRDHRRMATTTHTPPLTRAELWRELAQQLRVDSIRATAVSGSGHPTSSMSAADLIAVLAEKYLRYDFEHPNQPNNDHLIFSKGHASPLLYALYAAAGAISDEELLTLRRFGSRLEGIRARLCHGSMSPPARWASACPSVSASRSLRRPSILTPTASGCWWATARWRRDRSGKRSSTPRTGGSTI
jgi:Transketolase, thiamine diphosphate binding domain